MIENDASRADCILYVNNFLERETFPPKNKTELPADARPLEEWLAQAGIRLSGINSIPVETRADDSIKISSAAMRAAEINLSEKRVLILADNRFYNGADAELVAAVFRSKIDPAQIAYAGWNTSGNTIGSALALGFLRARMTRSAKNLLNYKKLLFARFIEDWVYMTIGRDQVRSRMQQQNLKQLTENGFEQTAAVEMKELLNRRKVEIVRFLDTDFSVGKTFFPWHRPFEIGFMICPCAKCVKEFKSKPRR